jgi:hypothetical protein
VGGIRRSFAAHHGAAVKPEVGSWQHDLVNLLETFERLEVPYLVAGGYAVAHAGHLRATKDIDLYVPRLDGVDECLARALSEFLGGVVHESEVKPQFLRFFVGRPGAIDIIRKLPGVTWATAWREHSVGQLFGTAVPFLGIETLIRNKRAVGRHIDLADVEELVRIRRERQP